MSTFSQVYDPITSIFSIDLVDNGISTVQFSWSQSTQQVTLTSRPQLVRTRSEFLHNIDEILTWVKRANLLFALPDQIIPNQYTWPFLIDVSLKKDATKFKYTGNIGAIVSINFEYKYSDQNVTIGARASDVSVTWNEFLYYILHLRDFRDIVESL